VTNKLIWLAAALILAAAFLYVRRPTVQVTPVGLGEVGAANGVTPTTAPDVDVALRLDRLDREPGSRPPLERDLFRFEARRSEALATPANRTQRATVAQDRASVDSGPPPPPPIPLRFIGYLDSRGGVPRVGVMSDGRGNVFNGREGDIIEGRFRVLRVGTDSADLAYVDGRGRQTIRLSGQ